MEALHKTYANVVQMPQSSTSPAVIPTTSSSSSPPVTFVDNIPAEPTRYGVLRYVGPVGTALRLHPKYPEARTSEVKDAENGRRLNFTRRKEVPVTLLDGCRHVIYFYDIVQYRGLWLHDHNPDFPDTCTLSVKSEPYWGAGNYSISS